MALTVLKVTGYSCARRAKLILAVEVRCHKVQGMTEAFLIAQSLANVSAVSLEKSGKYGFLVN